MAYPDDGDPFDLQILDAVRTKLLSIAAPLYFTTVAGAELWELSQPRDNAPTPFVFIVPITDRRSPFPVESKRRRQMLLTLVLRQTFIPNATDWQRPLFRFRADVHHAFDTDIQLGGLVEQVFVDESQVFDAVPSMGVSEAVVNLSILYRHANDNPSSLN